MTLSKNRKPFRKKTILRRNNSQTDRRLLYGSTLPANEIMSYELPKNTDYDPEGRHLLLAEVPTKREPRLVESVGKTNINIMLDNATTELTQGDMLALNMVLLSCFEAPFDRALAKQKPLLIGTAKFNSMEEAKASISNGVKMLFDRIGPSVTTAKNIKVNVSCHMVNQITSWFLTEIVEDDCEIFNSDY